VTNGHIVADVLTIAGETEIRNPNGKITAFISPSLNANIEMRTTNGRVSVSGIEPTMISRTDDMTYFGWGAG